MTPNKFTGHLRSSPCCTGDATALQALPARRLEVGCFPPTLWHLGRSISIRLVSAILHTPMCDNYHPQEDISIYFQHKVIFFSSPILFPLQGNWARHAKGDRWQARWTTILSVGKGLPPGSYPVVVCCFSEWAPLDHIGPILLRVAH